MEASQSGLLCVTLLFPDRGVQCLGQCLIVQGHCFTRHALPRAAPALLAHVWEGGGFSTWGREEEAQSGLLGITSGCLLIHVINFRVSGSKNKNKKKKKKKEFLASFTIPVCHWVHPPLSCCLVYLSCFMDAPRHQGLRETRLGLA